MLRKRGTRVKHALKTSGFSSEEECLAAMLPDRNDTSGKNSNAT
jgi:hypothetical protein